MVKSVSSNGWHLNGYSLIEMILVLAVIAVIATFALLGTRSVNSTQAVDNARQEFLINVRSVQNKVRNGASGMSVKGVVVMANTSQEYFVDGVRVTLPAGVQIRKDPGSNVNLAICFANSNLTEFAPPAAPNYPGACTTTYLDAGGGTHRISCYINNVVNDTYFLCREGAGPFLSPQIVTVRFEKTNGTDQRAVILSGTGMSVNQIYAQ